MIGVAGFERPGPTAHAWGPRSPRYFLSMPDPDSPDDVPALIAALTERVAALEAAALRTTEATRTRRVMPRPTRGSRIFAAISGVFILCVVIFMTLLSAYGSHPSRGWPWQPITLGLLGVQSLLRAADGWEWHLVAGVLALGAFVTGVMGVISIVSSG